MERLEPNNLIEVYAYAAWPSFHK